MICRRTHIRMHSKQPSSGDRRRRGQQGIALITAIFLMVIMSVLGLIMVLNVNSDMLINGYYGNYRSGFYAADAGLSMARQTLLANVTAAASTANCPAWGANAGTGCTALPLPTSGTAISGWMTSVVSAYTNMTHVQANGSWPESFQLAAFNSTCNTISYNPTLSKALATDPTTSDAWYGEPTQYQFVYNYTLCVIGQGPTKQQMQTSESGSIIITETANPGIPKNQSFSFYGAFINNFGNCTGPLVPGTITGPQFTNGNWEFGTSGSYTFSDPVGQAGPKADYWFGNNCIASASSSYTSNNQTIAPNFEAGFNLNQASQPIPANDFSQSFAVLDGKGCGSLEGTTCGQTVSPGVAPTNGQLHQYLTDINGNAYPSTGTSSGVFLPYTGTTLTGGGFYVQGNVTSILLTPGTDGSGNLTQIYTIVQGSTTTTITTNIGANTTKVSNGSRTITLTGVPMNLNTNPASPGTLLYVNGTIGSGSGNSYTGLSGPGQGQAAIQDHVDLTIVAAGDIDVVGDLIYKTEPVTLNTADTLTSGSSNSGVLGLFTVSGNMVLNSNYSNNNLEVDGSMAAIGQNCQSASCGLSTPGNGINTLTVVGGRVEANAHSVTMNTSNTYYDRRFSSGTGFAPPFFPSTTVGATAPASAPTITPTVQRVSWSTTPQ